MYRIIIDSIDGKGTETVGVYDSLTLALAECCRLLPLFPTAAVIGGGVYYSTDSSEE